LLIVVIDYRYGLGRAGRNAGAATGALVNVEFGNANTTQLWCQAYRIDIALFNAASTNHLFMGNAAITDHHF
jgi:hypothetical protein